MRLLAMVLPLSFLIAYLASRSFDISTKPKPLDLPVALSRTRSQLVTSPNSLKRALSCGSVVSRERFVMMIFIMA